MIVRVRVCACVRACVRVRVFRVYARVRERVCQNLTRIALCRGSSIAVLEPTAALVI